MAGFRDNLDRRLVALLQANARETSAALAKKLGVARSTVHDRVARLERDGVIAGYTAIVRQAPETDMAQALVLLSVTQQKSRAVTARLESYPEIKLCLAVSGQYDMFLSVETPRLEDLDVLLDDIAEIPGIERSRSVIVLSRKFDRRNSRAP